jgi:pyridinium-3,5-biscarboxylic acid mononucleotide sulfurtransferase
VREALVRAFRELGFQYVTLDLEGFRSGSMNAVIPAESLLRGRSVPAAASSSGGPVR